ncbi:MAG TPA: PLD nuclease N-terminal domain-containing protein [Caulobacterales bacterium]|nr:PLD nuclease N-terminal domain-containing protein [Caulobacterales bacterium]
MADYAQRNRSSLRGGNAGRSLAPGRVLLVVGWILAIWSVIHIAQSNAGPFGKALWIAAVLFFPVLGFIAWLLFGPRSAKPKT